jgi:hypothetical protein
MATVVGLYTGNEACVVASLSANRSEATLQNYVGTLVQDALMALPLRADSFDQVLAQCWLRMLDGYRHSRFDAVALWKRIADVRGRRGTHFFRDFEFNDQRLLVGNSSAPPTHRTAMEPRMLTAAMSESAVCWLPTQSRGETFVLDVHRLDADMAELSVRADDRRLSRETVEAFLIGVERLLVDASCRDVPISEVPAVTGIRAVPRGPEWVLVDSCWIDLTEVRRLMLDVPGVRDAEVVVVRSPAPRLHGRAVVTSVELTPGRLRESCAARLAGRPAAMVPHVCTVVSSG